jgi:hypothetical protein
VFFDASETLDPEREPIPEIAGGRPAEARRALFRAFIDEAFILYLSHKKYFVFFFLYFILYLKV